MIVKVFVWCFVYAFVGVAVSCLVIQLCYILLCHCRLDWFMFSCVIIYIWNFIVCIVCLLCMTTVLHLTHCKHDFFFHVCEHVTEF